MTTIVPKSTKNLNKPQFLIWGRPNVGKSVTSVTASKYVDVSKLGVESQVAEDVFYIGTEDGVAGLEDALIEVPNWFDLTEHMLTKEGKPSMPVFQRAQDEVFAYIHKYAKPDSIIVYDSLTATDVFANGFYSAHNSGGKYDVLNSMSSMHLNLSLSLSNLPGTLVIIAHGKAGAPIDNDETRAFKDAKAKVSGLSGKHMPTTLAVTGFGADHYKRNIGEFYYMDAKPVRRGGKTSLKRVLYPKGNNIAEGKTRFHSKLNDEEPADLSAIMAKIGVSS